VLRRYMHTARTLVVGSLLVLASVLMMSGPANAQPPPGCVDASVISGGDYGTVQVVNNCGTTQRVKVLIAHGPDSECFIIGPADTRRHVIDDHPGPGRPRFDGLRAC
jgi:hypothetical protein